MSEAQKEEIQLVFEERPKTIEERLVETFTAKLNDGTIESMVEKYAEKAIQEAVSDTFKSYGDGLGQMIEDKFKETLTPIIEKYNFGEHLIKMEAVLDDVIQQVAKPNKEILENFKRLTTAPMDEVKATELFKHYCEYVSKNVETYDREVDYDGEEPEYEPVEVTFTFEETTEPYSWSTRGYGQLVFEVTDGVNDDDELKKLNFIVPLMKSSDDSYWIIRSMGPVEIKDLRYMNEFEVLLRQMNQLFTHIIIDENEDSDTVYLEEKPEPSWS